MHTIPSRPRNADFKKQVLKNLIAESAEETPRSSLRKLNRDDIETILKYDAGDGFDLMLELHYNEGFELSRELLEDLDNYTGGVERARIRATQEWVQEYNVLNRALPKGTQVAFKNQANKVGTIIGVHDSEYWHIAHYEVSSPDLKDGQIYLIEFEGVEAQAQ